MFAFVDNKFVAVIFVANKSPILLQFENIIFAYNVFSTLAPPAIVNAPPDVYETASVVCLIPIPPNDINEP